MMRTSNIMAGLMLCVLVAAATEPAAPEWVGIALMVFLFVVGMVAIVPFQDRD